MGSMPTSGGATVYGVPPGAIFIGVVPGRALVAIWSLDLKCWLWHTPGYDLYDWEANNPVGSFTPGLSVVPVPRNPDAGELVTTADALHYCLNPTDFQLDNPFEGPHGRITRRRPDDDPFGPPIVELQPCRQAK